MFCVFVFFLCFFFIITGHNRGRFNIEKGALCGRGALTQIITFHCRICKLNCFEATWSRNFVIYLKEKPIEGKSLSAPIRFIRVWILMNCALLL